MRLVVVESPYAGRGGWLGQVFGRWRNRRYARACVRDALSRGEAPMASHLLYTQPGILCDQVPAERQWGIDAGLAWGAVAQATVVYLDRGVSRGMSYGIARAKAEGRPIEFRTLARRSPPRA
jgi:hypothetical protein